MSDERACANCGVPLEAGAPEGSSCETCATAAATLAAEEVAVQTPASGSVRITAQPKFERIGDFEVMDKLGQGGMGAVYRARQLSLDRLVALKILPSQFEEDETYVARFQREATVAANLNHPNLVRVFASGAADGCHYIAMELVDGENLRQFLRRVGPLPPADALRICLGVARGLQHGWQKAQLIHRDIKPSNIYLGANGEAKLGDLGLAKSLLTNTTGVTHTGTAIGTPHYISPEQARGDKSIDLRADIYSLGCTLYEVLTGVTPYQGSDPMTIMGMHIHSPPPAILKVMPQCPVPLGRIVNKMLRKAKHERHQSYEELVGAMDQALEQIVNPTIATGPSAIVQAWKEIGAAEQGILPARSAAYHALKGDSGGEAPALAKKSDLPRGAKWIGLAVAGLVVIALALVFIPSGKKSQRESAGTPAAAPSVPPAIAARATEAVTSASADRGSLNLWDSPDKVASRNARIENGELVVTGGSLTWMEHPSRDQMVRAQIRMNGDALSQQFALRCAAGGNSDRYSFSISGPNPHARSLMLQSVVKGAYKMLKVFSFPRAYAENEWVQFEFKAVGDELTATVEGKPVGTVHDTSLQQPGGVQVAGAPGYFREIVYTPLDGAIPAAAPSTPSTPSATSATFAPIKLWDSAEKIPAKPGASWDAGALVLNQASVLSGKLVRDVIYRASIRMNPAGESPQMMLRNKTGNFYRLTLRGAGTLALYAVTPQRSSELKTWTLPRAYGPGEYMRLEIKAAGDEFTVTTDGQMLGTVHDSTHSAEGDLGLYAGGNGYFRDIEYVPLDGGPGVSVLPQSAVSPAVAAATKATPFENSLGMRFAPVPIAGGPTAGQRVLVSIWKTRVQDYAAFATATSRPWTKPAFEQTPADPALLVSWDDAQAFCQWLTERERATGRIGPSDRYRLLSDHEWSCAVGIGDREDPASAPARKSMRIDNVYAWGSQWPPPDGTANLADETARAKGVELGGHFIEGYTDGFALTSPVGSFAANAYGLFDMAGDCLEWVEDWYDEQHLSRTARSCGCDAGIRESIIASRRAAMLPATAKATIGFRVALEPGAK